jgi:anti-sigma regulatory factor (Ser/Thr protein kinase)
LVEKAATFSFATEVDTVPRMRRFVSSWLSRNHIPEPVASELLLAVTEALNNACQHASPPGQGVQVSCACRSDRVGVRVIDDGPGFTPNPEALNRRPALDQPGGRGLFLMNQLTDHLEIDGTHGGTMVTLTRDLVADQLRA